ncbi:MULTISPECIES: UDP-N-acetylmuramate--L-alanine ligase [unclassified Methylophilus]|jgi:UDP-N-acetylmuramate--alanine ligase|uniref:UDP-N-acetylmuramate--L-alanine ligase n=1 Tax=unclassified Methylophilus TaxID=2630143 RepID=UPI000467DAC8|nr:MULTISPECIES: UDP-N-acetylmuramate--L-alanine ligase [unclassified Methylophilus]HCU85399.1 UDP-N-acetylmuramate--L-alanine ligase [Methylophilus sp.]
MKHKVKKIHFIGIGGSGMSGIAEVLLNLDFEVSGSDLASNATTKRLQGFGATVFQGHATEHLNDADVVVVSSAINEENPEIIAARARKVPVIPRAVMLAELMRFKQGIAIAGTHGKTTTTSLIASILAEADMDPTFVIGGKLEAASANARLGTGEWIVVEADESDASFLHLTPIMAVVTNIDQDHMDTYEHSFEKLKTAFVEFLQQIPFWGMAVLCIDDANVREILPRVTRPVTTYGTHEEAAIRAENIVADNGKMHFTLVRKNGVTVRNEVTLNLPGHHYVLNALAAIAIATELNVPDAAILKALAEFRGVGRRFERYGEIPANGGHFTLVDDYGHHPIEMQAVIAAARGAFPDRRLVLAFQPHRYTRTRDCFEDFVKVLSTVDALLLTEVYSAGEAPIVAADTRSLIRAIRVNGKVEPRFVETTDELPATILESVQPGDVVVVMGAGNIGSVAAKTRELASV